MLITSSERATVQRTVVKLKDRPRQDSLQGSNHKRAHTTADKDLPTKKKKKKKDEIDDIFGF